MQEMKGPYYVIFFDKEFNIVRAHESKKYPMLKDIVFLLKSLEQTDLKTPEDLMMDILTEKEYKNIKGTQEI